MTPVEEDEAWRIGDGAWSWECGGEANGKLSAIASWVRLGKLWESDGWGRGSC